MRETRVRDTRTIRTIRTTLASLGVCVLASCGGNGSVVQPEAPVESATSLPDLLGATLVRTDGTTAGTTSLAGKALIGLYFSAGWCPSCAGFTPVLVSAYDTLRQAGSSFDVVLVSLDNSADEMFSYMKRYAMPWLATPFSRERTQALIARYDVQWIPTLLVIDGACKTVSRTGREEVLAKGAGAYEYWLSMGGPRWESDATPAQGAPSPLNENWTAVPRRW